MKTLRREPYFYVLFPDEAEREYFRKVTCGSSALFELRVKLTPVEVKGFRENPDPSEIPDNRILASPRSFLKRKI